MKKHPPVSDAFRILKQLKWVAAINIFYFFTKRRFIKNIITFFLIMSFLQRAYYNPFNPCHSPVYAAFF